jgi:hypothetical protein
MLTATLSLGALVAAATGHRAHAQGSALTIQQSAMAGILGHAFHGDVWVVTPQVYYCPGDRRFGQTEFGAYMSEEAAKARGARSATERPCAPARPPQQRQTP